MDILHLLESCVKQNASDLHLSSALSPMLRMNGELIPMQGIPSINADALQAQIFKLITATQQAALSHRLELDFAMVIPDLTRFRVNVYYQDRGIAAVFRVIPEKIPTLQQLNFPPICKKMIEHAQGLILVTGPTGSGKSTTLAALVTEINNQQAKHIITIEDPIEFVHVSKKSLVNQRELHRDTHSFSAALRSALRADPDVILLGEMRDLETIRLALTAAETGHLVLATLHTSSAPRAINRIVDVFPESEKNMIRNMLSESLQAVIYQKLVKKRLGGRIAALEIMLATPAIRHLIREDKVAQIYNTMQTNAEIGMCTLEQYLQGLVMNQII